MPALAFSAVTPRTPKLAAANMPTAAPAAPAAKTPRLVAGPSYTSPDGKNNPKFPDVEVLFSITGQDGSPTAAKPADLKLISQSKEIGTASSIRTFEQTGYGLTAILALDASGSMKGAPINAIHASIAKFVNDARPQDRVEVVTFADQTQTEVPFGSSKDSLTKELETVQARGKFTRLYDGLMDAMDGYTSAQPKRRQLVVISDGHDEGSKHTLADVVVKAKSMGVVIDGIGLTKDAGFFLGSLQQLSQETGGSYQRAQNALSLEKLIGQGIQATRATPVATFKVTGLASDDKVHSTQLKWVPGSLTATVFIKTPKPSLFNNLWIWGLGVCFAAGILLLVLSLRGSKRKPAAAPPASLPKASFGQVPPSPAPASPAQPAKLSPLSPSRTPTVSETAPRFPTLSEAAVPGLYSAPSPTPFSVASEPTANIPVASPFPSPAASSISADPKARTRTKLAVLFEADESGPYAELHVQTGALAGRRIPVTARDFSIGAVRGMLLIPGDPTVSGQHARLLWEANILKIEDLGSTNGTFLNATRLTPGRHILRPGDEIRLGQSVMLVNQA
jgi:Mg-chelatase subunit ChlD